MKTLTALTVLTTLVLLCLCVHQNEARSGFRLFQEKFEQEHRPVREMVPKKHLREQDDNEQVLDEAWKDAGFENEYDNRK